MELNLPNKDHLCKTGFKNPANWLLRAKTDGLILKILLQ